MDEKRLTELANAIEDIYIGWEVDTISYIAEKLKVIGNMSPAELQTFNNLAEAKRDTEVLFKKLSKASEKSVAEVKKMYGETIASLHEDKRALFDYRGKEFLPLDQNAWLKSFVEAYARTSAETMINITQTETIGFVGTNGFASLEKTLYNELGKATISARTGGTTFHTSVMNAIERLGGSGARIQYQNITRRLDSVVRQNVLWGVNQAADEYEREIGEELDCDGIEIDYHAYSRPSHMFMQGKQYSIKGERLIGGKRYPDAERAGVLKALSDYGCRHIASRIICGISEPVYSDKELKTLKKRDEKTFDINGEKKSGYECTQIMRKLETEVRKEKVTLEGLKAGAASKDALKKHRDRIAEFKNKHQQIADLIGDKVDNTRMEIRIAK